MTVFLRTAIIAVAAGWLFEAIGMFLPWLLGPMLAMLFLKQFTSITTSWPSIFKTLGLLMLGVQLGSSFDRSAVFLMWIDLPYMAFMTASVVVISIILGIMFKYMAGETLATSMLGSLPGGLAQMVVIAEEIESASVTVVSMMQTFRIFLVVTIVPLLTVFLGGREAGELTRQPFSFSSSAFFVALVLGIIVFYFMKRISFPAAELLAPIFVMAIVQTVNDSDLIDMPYWLIAIAQVFIGANLGLQMDQLREKMSIRLGAAIVINNILLMLFTVLIAYVLEMWLPGYLFLDFFLSAAPGGMAEMAITALASGADVALVTSFHLFRLFFILLIAAPLVALTVKKLDAKSGN